MTFRQAPIFHGLFIGLLIAGALVALLIPSGMLVSLIIIAQVINGVLLPILLVFIVRLVNDRNIMGKYVNGRVNNAIAYTTVGLLSALSVIMIVSVVLPLFGVPFLQ
jgi:Mn2+/Fe2+ NRAMP family transporter